MSALFVSDIHLTQERPDIVALFNRFLDTQARQADSLYILGDLFEYWIGDDAIEDGEHTSTLQKLKLLTQSGTEVYVMVGNRDFLIGNQFAAYTGCKLLPDPSIISLYDENILLMHGDTLCTDDVEYQAIRKKVRTDEWRKEILQRSKTERHAISRQYREQSNISKNNKEPAIMDVNTGAVHDIMRRHHVRCLVHGHTHRPAIHRFTLDRQTAQRIVLADWYDTGEAMLCNEEGWQTVSISPENSEVS